MNVILTYLDVTEPDPPLLSDRAIRVSHVVAHRCLSPNKSRFDCASESFGLCKDEVVAVFAYYIQHRVEIDTAIERRNDAYRAETGA